MKRFYLLCLGVLLLAAPVLRAEDAVSPPEPSRKPSVYRGFDGGMLLHSGFLSGRTADLSGAGAQRTQGAPIGIGGVARVHLGEHFRVGFEGYVSTLSLRGNGSYVKQGWGGVLADFYWIFGRFQPYVGLTVGGGALTHLLMEGDTSRAAADDRSWGPVGASYYRKGGFATADPYLGCDFILTRSIHLSLKLDCLVPFGRSASFCPVGPRLYFGVLFYR